jgi:hypothetical protein
MKCLQVTTEIGHDIIMKFWNHQAYEVAGAYVSFAWGM